MQKSKTNEDLDVSTWGIGKYYSLFQILNIVREVNDLILISKYGYRSIDEKINFTPEERTARRIESVNRVKDSLKILMDNVDFNIKKGDQDDWKELYTKLKNIDEVIDGISTTKTDQSNNITKTIINERFFKEVLGYMEDMKREIINMLNLAEFIYKHNEGLEMEDFLQDLEEGG